MESRNFCPWSSQASSGSFGSSPTVVFPVFGSTFCESVSAPLSHAKAWYAASDLASGLSIQVSGSLTSGLASASSVDPSVGVAVGVMPSVGVAPSVGEAVGSGDLVNLSSGRYPGRLLPVFELEVAGGFLVAFFVGEAVAVSLGSSTPPPGETDGVGSAVPLPVGLAGAVGAATPAPL